MLSHLPTVQKYASCLFYVIHSDHLGHRTDSAGGLLKSEFRLMAELLNPRAGWYYCLGAVAGRYIDEKAKFSYRRKKNTLLHLVLLGIRGE
jgi:hypothetical protein